jgi:hypothetical protein
MGSQQGSGFRSADLGRGDHRVVGTGKERAARRSRPTEGLSKRVWQRAQTDHELRDDQGSTAASARP